MEWLFYAILAAIIGGVSSILEKKVLFKEHAMEFGAVVSLFTFLLSIPIFFYINYSSLTTQMIFIMLLSSLLAAIAAVLWLKSFRHMEISSSAPLTAFGPAFIALSAFLFLGEALKPIHLLGLFVLIIGAYILETKSNHKLLEPIKEFLKSKYIHLMFFAMLLYALCATVERAGLSIFKIPPSVYVAFSSLFLLIYFTVMMFMFHDGFKGFQHGIKNAGNWIFLIAILLIGIRFAQFKAMSLMYVALVLGVKRLYILIATIIGGELFHDSRILRKSIAAIIMVGGAILLAL